MTNGEDDLPPRLTETSLRDCERRLRVAVLNHKEMEASLHSELLSLRRQLEGTIKAREELSSWLWNAHDRYNELEKELAATQEKLEAAERDNYEQAEAIRQEREEVSRLTSALEAAERENERLRDFVRILIVNDPGDMREAADEIEALRKRAESEHSLNLPLVREIERLRAEVLDCKESYTALSHCYEERKDEIKSLRSVIRKTLKRADEYGIWIATSLGTDIDSQLRCAVLGQEKS